MEYKNKVILVTGASSGIGREIALALAAHGNKIVITARREALLREVTDAVIAAGSECTYYAGDALDPAHSEEVIQQIVKTYGCIDIAVLNVGAGPVSNSLTASREQILGTMRTNYDSLVNFYVPLMRQMRLQKKNCMIAHVNSLATYFGLPMQGDYTAAKAAARIFLETARMELKHFGQGHIKIQTIHPGFVATEKSGDDSLPQPNRISAQKAAEYVLRGIRSEVCENRFPRGTAFAARIGRLAPLWLKTKVLLAGLPDSY